MKRSLSLPQLGPSNSLIGRRVFKTYVVSIDAEQSRGFAIKTIYVDLRLATEYAKARSLVWDSRRLRRWHRIAP